MSEFLQRTFGLAGKTALVTGSSQGLGLAMAQALARAGAQVAINGRDAGKLDKVRADFAAEGLDAVPLVADLSRRADVERLIAAAIERLGRLDILVNNAGIIRRAPVTEMTDEAWDEVLRTNLDGVFTACRAAGRHMLERGSGKVINIASLLSFFGGFTVAGYAASKGAVAQLTKALSNEWAGRGIQVNAIAPGYMRTANTEPLVRDAARYQEILTRIPAGRWGLPADLEGTIIFLASSASDYLSGQVLAVDGGWCGR